MLCFLTVRTVMIFTCYYNHGYKLYYKYQKNFLSVPCTRPPFPEATGELRCRVACWLCCLATATPCDEVGWIGDCKVGIGVDSMVSIVFVIDENKYHIRFLHKMFGP